MRKNLAKLIALMMALVLVFSFAACGGKDEDTTESDTANAVQTEDTATPDATGDTAASDETVDSAAPSETGDSKQEPGSNGGSNTPAPGGIAVPATKEDAVKLYNDALKKISSTSAKIDRKLTKTDSSAGNLDGITNGAVSKKFAEGSGALNSKLSALSAADVQTYSKSESGNNIVMTFTLKNVKGGAELAHGKGGYMYFLTMDEISTVVTDIGKSISESFKISIKKDKSSIELQGGKLVVTVDKTTGKMSSAVLDFTEVIDGSCTALGVLPVNADLVGVGKVTYTLK